MTGKKQKVQVVGHHGDVPIILYHGKVLGIRLSKTRIRRLQATLRERALAQSSDSGRT